MTTDTRERILELARLTVQDRGYAGLSFRELAKEVGIKSASIHHYFPTKGELGGVLAHRYTADFEAYLEGLLTEGLDAKTCLAKYVDVFRTTLKNENRMCLGGMMAAEHKELPAEVQVEVVAFAAMNVRWLAKVLGPGPRAPSKAATRRALAIFAAVEGAQLVARSHGDVAVYDDIVETYRTSLLVV